MTTTAIAAPIRSTLKIPAGPVELEGDLVIPAGATGLVLFAHGSGSSRLSPRNRLDRAERDPRSLAGAEGPRSNRFVAGALQQAGIGTLLIDLIAPGDERDDLGTGELRYDVRLLAARLADVWGWAWQAPETGSLPIGFFGASTGAASALVAAAYIGIAIRAVVSRGGRPDLAEGTLRSVRAPTLLIVGGDDETVLRLNQLALTELPGVKQLAVVPGATHLFEEPGALEQVAELASRWFVRYLRD